MACLLHYSLDASKHSNWTSTQEKTISRDYPFLDLHAESPDQYVVRTYLQFLWLPVSIMPMAQLVPALLRANVESPSQQPHAPHPLLALLEPLLLTPRSAADKHHVELPRILSNGGGAGEIEENMMWFTLHYEKSGRADDIDEGPWADADWRRRWLERLERREVQIQILLHLLALSLQDARTREPSPPRKKRRRAAPEAPSMEDRLEAFMDKLSMWQLVERVDMDRTGGSTHPSGTPDNRDWMQAFCEDVVERQSRLPEACALLRTKVFPNSPFSDFDTSPGPSRTPSPERGPPETPQAQDGAGTRSRSLSVTLALDADARRAGAAKKRVLNREVSMSRVFKGKGETKRDFGVETRVREGEGSRAVGKKVQVEKGRTLVAGTPVKRRTRV